jgi:hypothetical protein
MRSLGILDADDFTIWPFLSRIAVPIVWDISSKRAIHSWRKANRESRSTRTP